MGTAVLIHLAGGEIDVRRNQELLGIQGKRKTVRKRIARGLGVGGEMELGCASYKYAGVDPGFAEHDLEEFDAIAEDLAWTRTLGVLREAFGIKVSIERIRDQHMEGKSSWHPLKVSPTSLTSADVRGNLSKALATTSSQARVVYTPTMIDSASSTDMQQFYMDYLRPTPSDLNARLISRTVGINRVVDEISLSFCHDREVPWLLPRVPPTEKKIEITMVSIVCIKAGVLAHEHVYWDQASVLAQVGLIDPSYLPDSFHGGQLKRLPIAGGKGYKGYV